MNLYNTMSRAVEPLAPAGRPVTLYVCGITPYDTTHLGHAFTYAAADVLVRYLEYRGRTVRYVQNVTDIDDDILRKAAELGEDWRALGNRWTAHFIGDMQRLNVRPPDAYPRATDVIPDIVAAVGALVDRGLGYASGGSVYYSVAGWPGFGRLSHVPRSEMLALANERGNRPDDPHKRDPLDFVLWQAQAPGEPAWPSPWGPGRPGWHIECSVMSTRFLGPTLDLHGGGGDLIFPHHECEIAQAEPLTGRAPFVRGWVHIAMVEHEGAKMSKSLGNLVMVRDLLVHWPADALRLYLAGHHYRRSWSHDPEEIARADRLARTLRTAVTAAGGRGGGLDAAGAEADFAAAMDDDLDTPAALGRLEGLADDILGSARAGRDVAPAQAVLRRLAEVFGLRLDAPGADKRVVEGWDAHLERFPAAPDASPA
ncbi:MAG TPA: cysteine--tRNA ligase [Candidatus Binatia bacterium]|nr:cysteine--tRNA ligase [Candidatus Binatia bacterium]